MYSSTMYSSTMYSSIYYDQEIFHIRILCNSVSQYGDNFTFTKIFLIMKLHYIGTSRPYHVIFTAPICALV